MSVGLHTCTTAAHTFGAPQSEMKEHSTVWSVQKVIDSPPSTTSVCPVT